MNLKGIIHKNIRWHTRYYRLVAMAVTITVAIITGSLVVGDSVRTTLVRRVAERLGNTETILFSRNSFMAEEILQTPLFDGSARGILFVNGFIPHNGKLTPVFVWGTDDMSIQKGEVKINLPLAKELGRIPTGETTRISNRSQKFGKIGRTPTGETYTQWLNPLNPKVKMESGNLHTEDIVLRLPATGLVPSGSLFVTENYTTSLRLSFGGIVDVREGGNISMKNEQTLPFNLFMNREELAEALETEGKINLVLSEKNISSEELEQFWNYGMSGLSFAQGDGFTEIVSDRIFLQEEVTATVCRDNQSPNRLFSYLANAIQRDSVSIPYSFVTAMDRFGDEPLQKEDIILSDYAAKRLQAKMGDRVEITYFTSRDLKTLVTKTTVLRVKEIVPLSRFMEDETLSADFPGLSDVENCTDWDSDLPIDMNLITEEDEQYWELYKNTPKAIVAYEAVAHDWSNAYGNATAIRVADRIPDLSGLHAAQMGIQLVYPREAGLYAAKNGVDFASLFLALGFFIILSALLLMVIPLSEMFYQRRHETNLLQALGYTRKRIMGILWRESVPVVFVSSVIGVIAGLLYTFLLIWLLGNVWKGATHTEGFAVYPDILTILYGFIIGTGISLGLLRVVISRNSKKNAFFLSIEHHSSPSSYHANSANSPHNSNSQYHPNSSNNSHNPNTPYHPKSSQSPLIPAVHPHNNNHFSVLHPQNPDHNPHLPTSPRAPLFSFASFFSLASLVSIATLFSLAIIILNIFFLYSVTLFVISGAMLITTAALWLYFLICGKGVGTKGAFRRKKMIWNRLYADRKQAMLSFFTLAMGVFIVFSVGLNRKGFADSAQIRSGTGGYSLWCESSVPIYHTMSSEDGREKLSLTGLPSDTRIMQCLRLSADDASCLNLNKITTPTILGIETSALLDSDFKLEQGLYSSDRASVFEALKIKNGTVYPALVDATVLTWSLGMNLGDTLYYKGGKGEEIAIQLVGTLSNSIFQGHILIDRRLFSEIWEETTGSEVFLLKVDENEKEETKQLLSQALSEYGVHITTTNERLRQFNTVTDTYLTIFLTLGGLGLLLGIMGFVIVVRKNLATRLIEVNMYRTLGFTDSIIAQTLYRENLLVPLFAIVTGVIGSIVGVSTGIIHAGIWVWLTSLVFTLFFVASVIIFVKKSVGKVMKRGKLKGKSGMWEVEIRNKK